MGSFEIPETIKEKLDLLCDLKRQINTLNVGRSIIRSGKDWIKNDRKEKTSLEERFSQIIDTFTLDEILLYYKRATNFRKSIPLVAQDTIRKKLLTNETLKGIYDTLNFTPLNDQKKKFGFIKVSLEYLKLLEAVKMSNRLVKKYQRRVSDFAMVYDFDANLWLNEVPKK